MSTVVILIRSDLVGTLKINPQIMGKNINKQKGG